MTRRRRTTKTPEGYVQSAVMEYLAAERVWFKRMNSRTVQVPNGFNGKTRPVYFGWPGMADILATPRGTLRLGPGVEVFSVPIVLWIECKAPDGKQSAAQKDFELEVLAEGHHYLLARSIDDVRSYCEQFLKKDFHHV